MKKPTEERLSLHLLEKARKFLIYPEPLYRNRNNLAAQQLFDQIGQELITQRETFMAGPLANASLEPGNASVLFDELYCRSLLVLIPDIVARTLRLRRVGLAALPKGQLLTYVKEASRTYAMGFLVASVALSRTALEAAVRPRAAKYLGKDTAAGLDLSELIDRAQIADKGVRDSAHRARMIANDVIHQGKRVSAEDTLDVIEAVRTVIVYVEKH